MKIFTIGHQDVDAEAFFRKLSTIVDVTNPVIVDIRINPSDRRSDWASQINLQFLLRRLTILQYSRQEILNLSQRLKQDFPRLRSQNWPEFEPQFRKLLDERSPSIEYWIRNYLFSRGGDYCSDVILLGSSFSHRYCHRRIVAEYLRSKIKGSTIHHL